MCLAFHMMCLAVFLSHVLDDGLDLRVSLEAIGPELASKAGVFVPAKWRHHGENVVAVKPKKT